jgi:UDP:flavonoid glycosyltransferase YjiC (YdhE family)
VLSIGRNIKLESLGNLSVERIPQLVEQVLENPRYREKAREFRAAIARTRGLDLAANVIEGIFKRETAGRC